MIPRRRLSAADLGAQASGASRDGGDTTPNRGLCIAMASTFAQAIYTEPACQPDRNQRFKVAESTPNPMVRPAASV